MAYIPPHKRHADTSAPTPFPVIIPKFKHSHFLNKPKLNNTKIVYSPNCISRWWTAGSTGEDPIPASFHLHPFDCEDIERRKGTKPMVLTGEVGVQEEKPWVRIAERLLPDLVETAKQAIKVLKSEREDVKLSFLARTGKVFFLGDSADIETIREAAGAELISRYQLHKLFYTNVPRAYMDDIVSETGFEFDSDKEHYHVKVFDKYNPESTISCKCVLMKDTQELHIHKVELNHLIQLVADVSCLTKDRDLRLMLVTKRTLKNMDDEESNGIRKLVSSAIIDPDVKGGLRWQFGEEFVANRFTVVGVWHTKYKAFKNKTMRLKLRHADRFDHRISAGEVFYDVTLKQTEISKHLREDDIESGSLGKMVEDAVELIWKHFLTKLRDRDDEYDQQLIT